MRVDLRPLTREDFGLLGAWLQEPLVQEWWHDDHDPAALERQYGAAIDGREPAELRIGEMDGEPVGFVQWYRLADEPGYAAELAPFLRMPAGAWSLDYLVGAPEHRGRGIGTALVLAALAAIGSDPVVVPVHADNVASAAVLRRAGFVLAARADLEPDNPAHSRRHLVLVRHPTGRGDQPESPPGGSAARGDGAAAPSGCPPCGGHRRGAPVIPPPPPG